MPKYLTVKDVAGRLGVCPNTVYQMCEARKLRHIRVSGRAGRGTIRVAEADLDAYLASVTAGPADPPAATPVKARKITIKHLTV